MATKMKTYRYVWFPFRKYPSADVYKNKWFVMAFLYVCAVDHHTEGHGKLSCIHVSNESSTHLLLHRYHPIDLRSARKLF
jgi:hypothetical protein